MVIGGRLRSGNKRQHAESNSDAEDDDRPSEEKESDSAPLAALSTPKRPKKQQTENLLVDSLLPRRTLTSNSDAGLRKTEETSDLFGAKKSSRKNFAVKDKRKEADESTVDNNRKTKDEAMVEDSVQHEALKESELNFHSRPLSLRESSENDHSSQDVVDKEEDEFSIIPPVPSFYNAPRDEEPQQQQQLLPSTSTMRDSIDEALRDTPPPPPIEQQQREGLRDTPPPPPMRDSLRDTPPPPPTPKMDSMRLLSPDRHSSSSPVQFGFLMDLPSIRPPKDDGKEEEEEEE